MDLLSHPIDDLSPDGRLLHVSQIQAALGKSRDHAFFASRSPRAQRREIEFHHFLELKLENVGSAIAMIQHQIELEQEEGFLRTFLQTTAQEARMPAQQYRRRADDILEGLWHMLRMAHSTYYALHQASLAALTEDEQARYHRAHASFREEAMRKLPDRPTPPGGG